MTESVKANSQTETSPVTGASSLGSTIDTQGLQTVPEFPRNVPRYNDNGSLDNRLLSKMKPPDELRDASPDSSFGRSYSEKQLEASPRRLRHTAPAHATPEAWQQAGDSSVPLRNGNHRNTKRESALMQAPPKKERKAGFRSTLRRMFSRRSTRDRISMPDPTVYPRHVSGFMHLLQRTTLTSKQGSGRVYHLCDRIPSQALCLCTDQRCPAYQWPGFSPSIPKNP